MSSPRVLFYLLSALSATAVADEHKKGLQEHYEHLAYIAEFKCHVPQPRVLFIDKLMSKEESQSKAYFPDVTVLHRCDDQCGTCTSGEHCSPAHQQPVDLPFKVTFLDDVEHHKRGSWVIEYHTFDNHTECACVHATPAE